MIEDLFPIVLLVHAAATWLMIGLIWFVQIVHYPLLRAVPEGSRAAYLHAHQTRTTLVVAPTMLAEAVTAGLLVIAVLTTGAGAASDIDGTAGTTSVLVWAGTGLLAVVWGSTFGVQVPIHSRLLTTPRDALVRRLVLTNWVRTIAWSARGVVAALLLGVGLG